MVGTGREADEPAGAAAALSCEDVVGFSAEKETVSLEGGVSKSVSDADEVVVTSLSESEVFCIFEQESRVTHKIAVRNTM